MAKLRKGWEPVCIPGPGGKFGAFVPTRASSCNAHALTCPAFVRVFRFRSCFPAMMAVLVATMVAALVAPFAFTHLGSTRLAGSDWVNLAVAVPVRQEPGRVGSAQGIC